MKKILTMVRSTLLFLVLAVAFNFVPIDGFGQCDLKFEYRVEEASSTGNGKIFITLLSSEDNYTFKLFDWNDGKDEFIKVIDFRSLKRGEEVLVFDNLKSSTYTVQAFLENGCQTSIGGINKIVLSAKN